MAWSRYFDEFYFLISRLEGAWGYLTQFMALCSVIGGM